jgi:hypothetical protein
LRPGVAERRERRYPTTSIMLGLQASTCRNCGQPTFEVIPNFGDISAGDTAHGNGCGDDDIGEFGEQVVPVPANTLPGIYPRNPISDSVASPTSSVSFRIRVSTGTSPW